MDFKFNYSICACIKDENEYLDEWVEYHLNLGFEHIWLYDNFSKEPVKEYIKNKPYSSNITVIEWKEKILPQISAYEHFINSFEKYTEWVTFIDIDEFYDFYSDKTIDEVIKRYPDNKLGAIKFCWKMFNADGQIKKLPGGVRERFRRQVRNYGVWDGKYICKPAAIEHPKVHYCITKPGYSFIGVLGDPIAHPMDVCHDFSICSIDHYYTRSLEEWEAKIKRGTSDENCRKNYGDFFNYNLDLLPYVDWSLASSEQDAHCDIICKYAVCLCIKDEGEYLDEWIKHHLNVGFEHIFIYDNNSKIPVKEYVKGKEYQDKVTIIPWDLTDDPQNKAYQHFCKIYRNKVEWCSFLDIDEFFTPTEKDTTVDKLISYYKDKYGDTLGAVHFAWRVYNADGQTTWDHTKGVKERFHKVVPNLDPSGGKYICKLKCVKLPHIHHLFLNTGYKYIDESGNDISAILNSKTASDHSTNICSIDHYYTKSLEEWCNKIRRGSADNVVSRNYMMFFDYNPDLIQYADEKLKDWNQMRSGGSNKDDD